MDSRLHESQKQKPAHETAARIFFMGLVFRRGVVAAFAFPGFYAALVS